jgi:hypothetical protein
MENPTDPNKEVLAQPIRALFVAILTRALKDIFKPTYGDHESYRTQALYWMALDDFDSVTSFINICKHIEIDVDIIRRKVDVELSRMACGHPHHIKFNLSSYKFRPEIIQRI